MHLAAFVIGQVGALLKVQNFRILGATDMLAILQLLVMLVRVKIMPLIIQLERHPALMRVRIIQAAL